MRTLLNYQVLENLGESLHSEVFKVQSTHTTHPQILVLKQIKPQFNSAGLLTYLQQQIEQLSELSLPYTLIPILETPTRDNLFLVRNFCEGITLTQWLNKQQTFKTVSPLKNWQAYVPELKQSYISVLKVVISIAERLAENHQAGHIHKGIKPNNILINEDTLEARLIDDVRILDRRIQLASAIHF